MPAFCREPGWSSKNGLTAHAIEAPDPIAAIGIRMDELGRGLAELGVLLGIASGRVSEILNRRRRLTIDMMRVLCARLQLSEACLLQPYPLAAPACRIDGS